MQNRLFIIILFYSMPFVAFSQNTLTGSFQFAGVMRDYRLYVPAAYNPSNPVPLVLNLHGYTSNNVEQEFYGSFATVADTANFLVLLPNGTIGPDNQRFWNNFLPLGTGVDDIGYINALLDTISAKYNINQNRIYSTGMSNGGFMSYDLACHLSNRIAAVASVTGSMVQSHINNCNPMHPMPVMEIHGTVDLTVPYTGGTAGNFVPIPDLMDFWKNFNDCTNFSSTDVPNTSPNDGCTAVHEVHSGGNLGANVEHFKIVGGGHTWPGAIFAIGTTNYDINASVEIWRFFRRYSLDVLTTSIPETTKGDPSSISVFPNPTSGAVDISFENYAPERSLQVFDSMGQLVFSLKNAAEKQVTISTGAWKSGLYLLQVKEGGKIDKKKLVKV